MRKYINYHKHDHISSFLTPDTHIKAEEYVKRAVELGDTMYFTTNHGTGGDIFEAKTLCDKYGLRCMFGIEGYIVTDPLKKISQITTLYSFHELMKHVKIKLHKFPCTH